MTTLLTAADVARWLQVSRAWVSQHACGKRRPIIPSVKMGKTRRFRQEDVERWLREMGVQA